MKHNSIKKIRKRKRIILVMLLVAAVIAGCKNGTKTDEPDTVSYTHLTLPTSLQV